MKGCAGKISPGHSGERDIPGGHGEEKEALGKRGGAHRLQPAVRGSP